MRKHIDNIYDKLKKKTDKEPSFAAEMLKVASKKEPKAATRVLLVGDPKLSASIAKDLKEEGIEVRCFKTIKSLKETASGREEAIIYCAPLVRSEILSVHKSLITKQKLRNLSFFAVVPHWMSDRKERAMYKSGIRMIFEWPRERTVFADLFSTALEFETLKVRSEDTDRSLRKAIINRMVSHYGSMNPKVEVSVYNGIVIMRGSVESVGERSALTHFLKKVPGVRGVIDSSIQVQEDSLPGIMKVRANQALKDLENVPDETLMVRVDPDQQHLKIVGSTASMRTLHKAKRKLELFRGVKKVETDVEVSPRQHARDLNLAKKAQRVINKLTLGSPQMASVKVFNGEAYLSGGVSSDIEAYQVENAVRSLAGINAVTNQLRVEGVHGRVSNL